MSRFVVGSSVATKISVFGGKFVPSVHNNWVKIVWLKKISLVYYAVNLLISWRLHEGSARNNLLEFFFAAIRSNWSPSSKRAVSKGAHKPNLAKIQVKLVLLKNKLTFWYHKVVLKNWEYLPGKSACNNFLKLFFARLFAIYGFSHVLRPN